MSDRDHDQNAPPETTENHMKTTRNHAETTDGGIHNQGNLQRDIARYSNDRECRLLTIKGLGYRSPAYRETKQLVAEIEADLGGAEHLSAMERQMIQHGAVLGAIAQDMEAKYLLGQRVDLIVLTRVLNAQRRAFDAIGYRRRQRDVTPTLDGFLGGLKEKNR
jgi:hypothetical protein